MPESIRDAADAGEADALREEPAERRGARRGGIDCGIDCDCGWNDCGWNDCDGAIEGAIDGVPDGALDGGYVGADAAWRPVADGNDGGAPAPAFAGWADGSADG